MMRSRPVGPVFMLTQLLYRSSDSEARPRPLLTPALDARPGRARGNGGICGSSKGGRRGETGDPIGHYSQPMAGSAIFRPAYLQYI